MILITGNIKRAPELARTLLSESTLSKAAEGGALLDS